MTLRERARDIRLRRLLNISTESQKRATSIINDNGGHGYGAIVVSAADATPGIGRAMLAALCEQESGFRNVFGHDPVKNPIKSPSGGSLVVTKRRYLQYKTFRKQGLGMQGVGITQPTWFAFQDQVDAMGGCWVPRYQILWAAHHLASLMQEHGRFAGVALYNGAGPAAIRYAETVLARRDVWRRRGL